MTFEEEVLLLLLLRKRRRRRRVRTLWIHPLLSFRRQEGHFYNLFGKLKEDENKFFNYFRMSISSFTELLEILDSKIKCRDTNMRKSISAEERLAITLRYLATGCTFIDLEYSYRCGSTTIGRIVRDVCQQIWLNLKNICISEPTEESWLRIANGFERRANFPNCIGAIDGKHIRIVKPTDSGSSFFNYKKYFSFVLLAICDSDYMFTFVDIGSYGRHCDSTIFKESTFYKMLQQKTLNIPLSRKIVDKGNPMPYVYVGDEAFSLSENLLRPYGGNNLSISKRIFNYRLSRARRYIECSFGVLANKWRIFHRPLNVSTEFAIDIVKACCILHNYVRRRDGYRFEDTLSLPESLEDPEENLVQIRPGGRFLNSIRDQFLQYFISDEGKVDWQLSKI